MVMPWNDALISLVHLFLRIFQNGEECAKLELVVHTAGVKEIFPLAALAEEESADAIVQGHEIVAERKVLPELECLWVIVG